MPVQSIQNALIAHRFVIHIDLETMTNNLRIEMFDKLDFEIDFKS